MIRFRTIAAGVALLSVIAIQNASAVQKRRGIVRLNQFPSCANQCDIYELEPDSGYSFIYLRADQTSDVVLSRYIDTHVEVTGYSAACGRCTDLFVSIVSPLSTTDIADDQSPGGRMIAGDFILDQNYPNPFNPVTAIRYTLARESFVTLRVFDALGRAVSTLVSSGQRAGDYRIEWDATGHSSGIYFCRLLVSDPGGRDLFQTRSMIFLR